MSESEVSGSDIFLNDGLIFYKEKKYLIQANSGHGKSSVLNFIYGSNRNFLGEITYDSKKLNPKELFSLRQKNISYVFQDLKLFEELSLFENIELKNKLTHHKTKNQIFELIEKVGLGDKKDQKIKTLSLGQRQRVAIIRALCQPFQILLMDEPFSHLDKNNMEILTKIIHKELEIQKASLLLTSLNESYLFSYDKVLNL